MSQWIRNYNPTEIDADEWNNILVQRENGQKAVYNWEDYVDDGMREEGCAWMPLPQSDIPKTVTVTIEIGEVSYTIENNGFTIEVHDSRDPMGQPMCFHAEDTIAGIREIVDDLLQSELTHEMSGQHYKREQPIHINLSQLTVEDIEDLLEAEARGNVDEDELMTQDAIDIAIYKKNMAAVPATKKPWNKKK